MSELEKPRCVPVERGGYWSIQGRECEITIQARPPYCDRGRFVANVYPRGDLALAFDHQDGFPRYYFDWGRMLAEIDAWMAARGQHG